MPNAADRFDRGSVSFAGIADADDQGAVGPAVLDRRVAADVVAVAVRDEDGRRRQMVTIQSSG